jgi:NADPH:quinone reductase-like Zn-dependent oxidoreductase
MRAVVHTKYGPVDKVLEVREIETPTPADHQVLVRVHASSVHPDVWHVTTGLPYALRLMGNGVTKPKKRIPGSDLAGVLTSVGKNVARLKVGDEVFGESSMSWQNGGGFAEYAAVDENLLVLKPANVTFAQAASVASPGYITMINLRPERIQPGHQVLINGAGGNVGSLAIQLAKARGARVIGVDHTSKLESMRALGADDVIDYTKENCLQRPDRYDLIFDVASTLSLERSERALTPNGIYAVVGHDHYGKAAGKVLGSIPLMLRLMLRASLGHPHLPKSDFKLPPKRDVMEMLAGFLESGVLTPVIARTFPLSEVPAAIQCLQEGRVAGRIVIVP